MGQVFVREYVVIVVFVNCVVYLVQIGLVCGLGVFVDLFGDVVKSIIERYGVFFCFSWFSEWIWVYCCFVVMIGWVFY